MVEGGGEQPPHQRLLRPCWSGEFCCSRNAEVWSSQVINICTHMTVLPRFEGGGSVTEQKRTRSERHQRGKEKACSVGRKNLLKKCERPEHKRCRAQTSPAMPPGP